MKTLRKKQIISLLVIFAILFNFVPNFISTSIAAQNSIFTDNFESYEVGTTVSSGGTAYTKIYNGTGDSNQVVISAEQKDGTTGNVLQLQGADGWSSQIKYSFTPDDKQYLIIEADVKPLSVNSPAGISLCSSSAGGTWTHSVCGIHMKNGGFNYGINDTGNSIDTDLTYTTGNWYRLSLVLDRTNHIFYNLLDGSLIGGRSFTADTATPEWIEFSSNNNGTNTAYFDNINLYSTDTFNFATVTFNSNGGSEVAAQTIIKGQKVEKPTAPTKSGLVFGGWYKEDGCINAWNFETDVVTETMTLYAKWEEFTTYPLWVGGTQVTNENQDDVLGDETVIYNQATNTLKLNNANITGYGDSDYGWGIKYSGNSDFNIVANGNNIVSDNETRKSGSGGLVVGGNVGEWTLSNTTSNVHITVNENSSLSFIGGKTTGGYYPTSCGISLGENNGTLTIDGKGTLNATTNDTTYSYGITTSGDVIFNSEGDISLIGSGIYFSAGIFAHNIKINSGNINIEGKDASVNSFGISTDGANWDNSGNGNITISGGNIIAKAGDISETTGGIRSEAIACDNEFKINGGTIEASSTFASGKAINKVPVIVDGMIVGASKNTDGSNMTIYKSSDNDNYKYFKAPVSTCTVTFNTNGGSSVANQIVIVGEKAEEPTIPTKSESSFEGWYKDSDCLNAWNFETDVVTETMTLYAKWNEVHTHNLTLVPAKDATCSATGNNAYYTCSGCDKVFTDALGTVETTVEAQTIAINPNAHDWDSGIVTTPATCTSEGVKTYTCTVCGETKTETIAKKSHTLETIVAIAPTCETDGIKTHHKCSECNKLFADTLGTVEITSEDIIDPSTGHDWGDWVETTPATVDEEGVKTRICKKDSSHKEATTIDRLPYAILEGDNQTFVIDSSKDISIKANGTFNKFLGLKMDGKDIESKFYTAVSGSTVVTLAQEYLDTLDEGEHILTFVYTDGTVDSTLKIAKTSTPEEINNNQTNTETTNISSSPKTGDNIIIWISLLVVSALGVMTTIRFIKKKA